MCHYCSVIHLSLFWFLWQTSPILGWTKTSTENNIQKISDPKWTQKYDNVGGFKWSRSGPCPLGVRFFLSFLEIFGAAVQQLFNPTFQIWIPTKADIAMCRCFRTTLSQGWNPIGKVLVKWIHHYYSWYNYDHFDLSRQCNAFWQWILPMCLTMQSRASNVFDIAWQSADVFNAATSVVWHIHAILTEYVCVIIVWLMGVDYEFFCATLCTPMSVCSITAVYLQRIP